ncbi:MAG TPA: signal peptidase I [Verrucomicrobiae bacterium]
MTSPSEQPPGPRVLRRWPGVLLSLLIPGAGVFFGGDRRAGLCWFFGLSVLGYSTVLASSFPLVPGLLPFIVLCLFYPIFTIWMLVRSFRPLDRLSSGPWTLIVLAGVALNVAESALTSHLSRAFRFPTGSMKPTLVPGDRVFVQTSAFWFRPPQRGEIVVFKTDLLESSALPRDQYYAKRVAAVQGEKVQIQQGRLVINGRPLEEAGVLGGSNFWAEHVTLLKTTNDAFYVPSNACFVIGDNVTNSFDSRHWGAVPYAAVIGRVTKIYWPISRAGDVR